MRGLVVVLAAASALGAAPALAGVDGPALIAQLNAQRAAAGVPAVVESPAQSARCHAHAAYMAATGVLAHDEDPGTPFYSAAGALAGRTSALATGFPAPLADPFAAAPLHRAVLLDPA